MSIFRRKRESWRLPNQTVDEVGRQFGRNNHRTLISLILITWVVFVISYIALLMFEAPTFGKLVLQWRTLLIIIQSAVGILMIAALIAWFTGNENAGIRFSISGLLLSLVALQTLYFYITQFSAVIAAMLQLLFLQVLYSYRLWYLESDTNR